MYVVGVALEPHLFVVILRDRRVGLLDLLKCFTLKDQFLHLDFLAGQGGAHLRYSSVVHTIPTDIRVVILGRELVSGM
jgi:hypothetical protein